ncbi:hypothetical protein BLNAU_14882 [Blattamonas nauphoetae]|uniref:Uncharacterized protein n=1 Tax=Blattamonas nauphoetae TaxID=2049346 RepID=A0ABQ9XCF6_9EUKA|nr:hypothetical protein BLNAU_14882 [Blattamonas nauphoetae]
MEEGTASLNTSNDDYLTHSRNLLSTVIVLPNPFLNWDPNSELSIDDKLRIYHSLVAHIKAEHSFCNALQDRAARFLKSLEPKWYQNELVSRLVTDLVPSSNGSTSGFVDSIASLLSCPHSIVVAAAISFLRSSTRAVSLEIRCRLVESDLVSTSLVSLQPHTLSLSASEDIFDKQLQIIEECLKLAHPFTLLKLGITVEDDAISHHEILFQKVVIASSQFVTFLISNRFILNGKLLASFMSLLVKLLIIAPFHLPTLEFVIASPIVMAFFSCLSIVKDSKQLLCALDNINTLIKIWKKQSSEVSQSGKQILQALISEGFENSLEQMLMINKGGAYGFRFVRACESISNSFMRTLLGCWEYSDCWCRRTDSGIASNRPEMTDTSSTVLSPNNS